MGSDRALHRVVPCTACHMQLCIVHAIVRGTVATMTRVSPPQKPRCRRERVAASLPAW